jgi:hypothetical protein
MEYESVECILLAWDREIQNVPFKAAVKLRVL